MDLFALADSDNDSEDETLASHNKNRRRSGHYDKTIFSGFFPFLVRLLALL